MFVFFSVVGVRRKRWMKGIGEWWKLNLNDGWLEI